MHLDKKKESLVSSAKLSTTDISTNIQEIEYKSNQNDSKHEDTQYSPYSQLVDIFVSSPSTTSTSTSYSDSCTSDTSLSAPLLNWDAKVLSQKIKKIKPQSAKNNNLTTSNLNMNTDFDR